MLTDVCMRQCYVCISHCVSGVLHVCDNNCTAPSVSYCVYLCVGLRHSVGGIFH